MVQKLFKNKDSQTRVLFLFVYLFLAGCDAAPDLQLTSISGPTMGTTYNVKYFSDATNPNTPKLIKKVLDERLGKINALMSTYIADSEVSRFNLAPVDEWFKISPQTALVVRQALDLCKLTGGAFDITVSSLVDLWGFGPSFRSEQAPSSKEVMVELENIGCQGLKMQERPEMLLKQKDFEIDLSAIAKGYAVDDLSAYLEQSGVKSYLVEIGGEIKSRGRKADGQYWRIAIESPKVNERTAYKTIALDNIAVATSGDYRNYFEQGGIRYSHTIDPATGYPIKHKLASATVFAENAMTADALATAFMVMGPDKALDYAEKNAIAVLLIVKDNEQFTELTSKAFTDIFR